MDVLKATGIYKVAAILLGTASVAGLVICFCPVLLGRWGGREQDDSYLFDPEAPLM